MNRITPDLSRRTALILAGVGLAAWPARRPMILHAIEAGTGRPVVLLHGLFGSARNFGLVQRRAAPRLTG